MELDNAIVKDLSSSTPEASSVRMPRRQHHHWAGGRPAGVTSRRIDAMTMTRRPSPFSELVTLRQAMDRLFDDTVFRPYSSLAGSGDYSRLPLDVRTTKDALHVEASLPGFRPEDVDITVENGTLTIRAEDRSERTEEQGGWVVREITRGSVMRTVTLPTGLEPDKAEATFENGMLRLRLPKAEQVKPRQIRIQPVTTGSAIAGDGHDPAIATGTAPKD
jgi:HSP20 family protein